MPVVGSKRPCPLGDASRRFLDSNRPRPKGDLNRSLRRPVEAHSVGRWTALWMQIRRRPRGSASTVVVGSANRVAQDLVGAREYSKLGCGLWVARTCVGVRRPSQSPIGVDDGFLRGIGGHTKHFVRACRVQGRVVLLASL